MINIIKLFTYILFTFFINITNNTTINNIITNKITIVLDAGHDCVWDKGTSVNNIYEGDINLSYTLKLKELLELDYNVILTRCDENYLGNSSKFVKKEDLNERIKIIEKSNCDLFISIHQNFYPLKFVKGCEIHYNMNNSQNKIISDFILTYIKNTLHNTTRNIKENNDNYILSQISVPACLIECGYMSNEEELGNLLDENYEYKFVKTIKQAIDLYFNII